MLSFGLWHFSEQKNFSNSMHFELSITEQTMVTHKMYILKILFKNMFLFM